MQSKHQLLAAAVVYILWVLPWAKALEVSSGEAASAAITKHKHDWRTERHEKGYCALYGTAGHRADHDALDRPNNTRAQTLGGDAYRLLQTVCPQLTREAGGAVSRYCCDDKQINDLSTKLRIATIFLVGCPACAHNFQHFFCELTCSPDQSSFANVTAVQLAHDTGETAVAEVDYFVSDMFGTSFYNSCKDVVYPIMSQKAMTFVGGGARNYSEWFAFLGLVKDKRFPKTGSPFQLNFPGEAATPASMSPLISSIPTCWDSQLRCSCGDCPDAPQCEPIPPPPPKSDGGCRFLGLSNVRCSDVALAVVWAVAVALLYAAFAKSQGGTFPLGFGPRRQFSCPDVMEPLRWSDDKDDLEDVLTERPHSWARTRLSEHYRRQGVFCAKRPWIVVAGGVLAVVASGLGLLTLKVETEPQKLWVGSRSQALAEKTHFEEAFGPFYRIEQLLVSTVEGGKGRYKTQRALPSILSNRNIELLFDMQQQVDELAAVTQDGASVKLTNVCYKPFGAECATQSLLQFWQMNRTVYEKGDPAQHGKLSPEYCLSHWSTACRGDYGGPQDPHTILGGFPVDDTFRNYTADASTFVVTYPLDSSPSNRAAAEAWEAAFLELASNKLTHMASRAGLRLAFSAERSVADELARESTTDAATVAWSYAAMLVYVAIALTTVPKGSRALALLVHSRAGLALGGVLCVAASAASALGLCSLVGVSATLIILEVMPFLVLAVGVDNMFILANAARRQLAIDPATGQPVSLPDRIGKALAEAGPSITLAAAAETLAFVLGGFTPMPAVRNFSLVAALAVLIDFLLQVTVFVALLALDTARVEAGRLDICPLLRLPTLLSLATHKSSPQSPAGGEQTQSAYQSLADADLDGETVGEHSHHGSPPLTHWSSTGRGKELGLGVALQAYMERIHAPLLQWRWMQAIVFALFGTSLLCGLAMLPRISRGLEQQVALPRDSYLQDFFQDVTSVMRVGPPLYFVVQDMNMSRHAPDVNHVCSVSGCSDQSVTNLISQSARQPSVSYIASPAASWIDDFLSWVSPDIPQCCRAHPDGSSCPPPDQEPCRSHPKACDDCDPCFQPTPEDPDGELPALDSPSSWMAFGDGSTAAAGQVQRARGSNQPGSTPNTLQAFVAAYLHHGRPSLRQVQRVLPWFLAAKPSEACAKGGAGAYTDVIQSDSSDATGVAGLTAGVVSASAFRTAYVPLSSQSDFIEGMQASRELADSMTEALGLKVYTFSVFHVFFEQYLTIIQTSILVLGGAIVAIGVVSYLMMGSFWAAAMLSAVIAALLIQLAGLLPLLGMQLNAVSVVNLAMAAGISVEFCAHIMHSFLAASGTRAARSSAALHRVGASVLAGITLTKFVGVAVLSRAQTQIFQIYFFRMYCALVVYAAVHSLVVLPVLLTLIGPPPHREPFPSNTNLSLQEELGPGLD